MRRLLSWAAPLHIAGAIFASAASADEPVDLELVLAVDVSRSIDEDEAALQRQGYVRAFHDPEVIRAIQQGILGRIAVTYFEWAGATYARQRAGWTLIDGPDTAETFLAKLAENPPTIALRTSISSAIQFGLRQFAGNGFEGTRRTIDVSGDGPNNDGILVTAARDLAVAAGVTINGLPIMDNGGMYSWYNIPDLDLYYENCVIGGSGSFIVTARDFSDFAEAVRRKLILEIAGGRPLEPPTPIPVRALVGARTPPPCNIGEQLRGQMEN